MICYRHALKRHNAQPLFSNFLDTANWLQVEVGSELFWNSITSGQLAAFEDAAGVYVGMVDEHDYTFNQGTFWICFKPDPTRDPLPDGQDTLPVAFGVRDKIMLEVI